MLRMGGRINRGSIISGEEASLQLSDPVPALGNRQTCVARQMAFEPKLIKLPIVKVAEFRRQATEGSDKPELRGDDVNDDTKPSFLGKLEAILGFTMDLRERISRSEKVCVQGVRSCTPQL